MTTPSPAEHTPSTLPTAGDTEAYYDAFPYDSFCFYQTHPSRLAAIARLFGAGGARALDGDEPVRVLEVGCAAGGNLVPMAVHFPKARFLGIDFSARQIADGNRFLAGFPLPNLELRRADIREMNESWAADGKFDYIIAHGVYSWVPADVQRHLLAMSAKLLTPAGLMYVSYNVNPGWRLRGAVRELMQYFSARFGDPMERVRQARALVDFLADAMRGDTEDPFVKLLQDESKRLREYPDYYVLHEYLEPCNEPLYFHEFADRARDAGLRYLGDARPATMAAAGFGKDVERGLRTISRDMIELEQFLDLLRSRVFRESILCLPEPAGPKLDHAVTPDRLQGLYLSAMIVPKHTRLDLSSPNLEASWTYGSSGKADDEPREISAREPLAVALLHVLSSAAPACMQFEDLVASAVSILPPGARVGHDAAQGPGAASPDELRRAGEILLGLIFGSSGVIELLAAPHPLTARPGTHPTACPLVRHQVGVGSKDDEVFSRRHQMVKLHDDYRELILKCDGRPRSELNASDADLLTLARHGLMIG